MAGDNSPDPVKALEFKEKGNRCFQSGEFVKAEALYSQAINHDPLNPLLYTNRAMSLLHFTSPNYTSVILDAESSIRLLPQNMKAYYLLAQAQIELHSTNDALASGLEAHRLCVEECRRIPMGKGSSSIGPITELVLRCKKESWEVKERQRLESRVGLERDIVAGMKGTTMEGREWEVRDVFERAAESGSEGRRRKVPDWCIDDITFSVMLDPVVTKTGQSYDRASLMEHLKRSSTDPLTREPLRVEDLRPNLALKEACAAFLEQNGWAVDW